MKIKLGLMCLLFAGCPGTCNQQVRRDYQKAAQWEVKTGEAKIEDTDRQVVKKPKTVKHLRPDGTPWKIETDGGELLTEKLKVSSFTNSSTKVKEEVKDVTRKEAWWKFPLMVLSSAVAGALLALVLIWAFRYGWPKRG